MRFFGLMVGLLGAFALSTEIEPATAAPGIAIIAPAQSLTVPVFHPGRTTSFYCYPKNYWWFYRPYTTASEGYQRCMPYFHYPVRPPRRGADGIK